MRKLSYGMNVTLDGYIAAPNDDIGWSVPSDELFQWWLESRSSHVCELSPTWDRTHEVVATITTRADLWDMAPPRENAEDAKSHAPKGAALKYYLRG
jgi:hypothetical protein